MQPHLVLFVARAHAGKRSFDDERGEMLAVHFRENYEEIGEAAIADPHLLAGQQVAAVALPRRAGASAERIRSRGGLAEGIRTHDLAADEPRDVVLLLLLRSEAEKRCDGETCLSAKGRGKRRGSPHRLADHDRRDLVERHAAEFLRDVGTEQSEVAAAAEERARQRPIFLLQPIEGGQNLGVDEVDGRAGDEPMIVSQLLGREDCLRVGLVGQPDTTAPLNRSCRHSRPVLLVSEPLAQRSRGPPPPRRQSMRAMARPRRS